MAGIKRFDRPEAEAQQKPQNGQSKFAFTALSQQLRIADDP
jgi:hypothetical protein